MKLEIWDEMVNEIVEMVDEIKYGMVNETVNW